MHKRVKNIKERDLTKERQTSPIFYFDDVEFNKILLIYC